MGMRLSLSWPPLWVPMLFGLGVVLLGMGFWWFFWGPGTVRSPEAQPGSLQPLDAKEVERGRQVYAANCTVCHRDSGEGDPNWRQQNADTTYPPPPHDSTGHTWHHSDGLLYRIVRDGGTIYETPGFKSAMPAFGDRLSPDEIRAVITYLKTLWGPKERSVQAQVSVEDPFSEADGQGEPR